MATRPERPKATKLYTELFTDKTDRDDTTISYTNQETKCTKISLRANRIGLGNTHGASKKAWEEALPKGFKSFDEMNDSFYTHSEAKRIGTKIEHFRPGIKHTAGDKSEIKKKSEKKPVAQFYTEQFTDKTDKDDTTINYTNQETKCSEKSSRANKLGLGNALGASKKKWEEALPKGFKSFDEMNDSFYAHSEAKRIGIKIENFRPGIKHTAGDKSEIKKEPNKKPVAQSNPIKENVSTSCVIAVVRQKTTNSSIFNSKQVEDVTSYKGQDRSVKHEQLPLKSLRITIMNASSSDTPSHKNPEDRRRHLIYNVVKKTKPDILLFQEFKWKGITGKIWENYRIPPQYTYTGHSHASILYNHDKIKVFDFPASEIDSLIATLQRSSNNGLHRSFPTDFTPQSRMCTKKVILNHSSITFITISWHGFNNNPSSRGKMLETKKIEYFQYLMEFLRSLRAKYKYPIMIGGDFNLNLKCIESLVESPFKVCLYKASERRTRKGILDYLIVTEEIKASDMTWFDIENEKEVVCPLEVLDHDPLSAIVNIDPSPTGQLYFASHSASQAYKMSL